MREALHSLCKEDEIVVYCSDASCIASAALDQLLERNGYPHVLHLAGAPHLRAIKKHFVDALTPEQLEALADVLQSLQRHLHER